MGNETIEDIVREMRARTSRSAAEAFYDRESWLNLCDRIEAAARRSKGDDPKPRRLPCYARLG